MVVAHIPLSQLRQMPGAEDLEDAWIRARLGQDGFMTGKDAEAAACDATAVPVVTGTVNRDVIDQMINLVGAASAAAKWQAPAGGDRAAQSDGHPIGVSPSPRALRHAIARLAIDLVSGPSGVAAVLRRGLLGNPYNSPSLPLDIG
jgi:hypothetical protein